MTVQDNALIEVQNLTDHIVVYRYDNEMRRRAFRPQQKMKVSAAELREVNYTKGGGILLRDYLRIGNKELAEEFGVEEFDCEYQWTRTDVDKLLLSGSVERLQDALDFAPAGIIDLIIERAVDLKLPDINKRKAIQEVTKKDINSMIEKKELANISLAEGNNDSGVRRIGEKTRRVAANEETATTTKKRRVAVDEGLAANE